MVTIKTQQRRQRRRSGIFIVFFKYISHLILVFLLFNFGQVNASWVSQSGKLFLQCVVSTKRSHILKQYCSIQLQVCLSVWDLIVDQTLIRVDHLVQSLNTHYRRFFVKQKQGLFTIVSKWQLYTFNLQDIYEKTNLLLNIV